MESGGWKGATGRAVMGKTNEPGQLTEKQVPPRARTDRTFTVVSFRIG